MQANRNHPRRHCSSANLCGLQAKDGSCRGVMLQYRKWPCIAQWHPRGLLSTLSWDSRETLSGSVPLPPQSWLWWWEWWQVRWYHYNYPSDFRKKKFKITVTHLQMFWSICGSGKMTDEMQPFCGQILPNPVLRLSVHLVVSERQDSRKPLCFGSVGVASILLLFPSQLEVSNHEVYCHIPNSVLTQCLATASLIRIPYN